METKIVKGFSEIFSYDEALKNATDQLDTKTDKTWIFKIISVTGKKGKGFTGANITGLTIEIEASEG